MDTLDLQFVNGSAPALSADNMNAIVSKINAEVMSINNLNSKYADMEDKVDEVISGVVPEAVVKEAVDDYVEEHSAGFATETELQSLNESLTNLIKTFTQNVSSNSNGTIYTAPINGIIVDCSTVQGYSVVHVKDNAFVLCDNTGTSFDCCPNVNVDIVIKYI